MENLTIALSVGRGEGHKLVGKYPLYISCLDSKHKTILGYLQYKWKTDDRKLEYITSTVINFTSYHKNSYILDMDLQ